MEEKPEEIETSEITDENVEEAAEISSEALQEKVQRLEEELAKKEDALLRSRADLQNQAKRRARDVEEARQYGITKLLEALLPLRDSMELGIYAALEEHKLEALLEGYQLNLKSLDSTLAQFGVELIAPESGEAFDPNLHEALSTVPTGEVPAGSIFQTHQKGVCLNGRVIRPARVSVAKEPETDGEATNL